MFFSQYFSALHFRQKIKFYAGKEIYLKHIFTKTAPSGGLGYTQQNPQLQSKSLKKNIQIPIS